MGKLILCYGNYSKSPFYLAQTGLSIYSIEELCYFISEHASLLDKDFMMPGLANWVRDECALEDLAGKLYTVIHKKQPVTAFVKVLMEETGYLSKEELETVLALIKSGDNLNSNEKKKAAADFLLKKGKAVRAINAYEILIQDIGDRDNLLLGSVNHNMGVAFCQLFEFESAAKSFYRAYELSLNPDSYYQYLAALRMYLPENEYIQFIGGRENHFEISLDLEKNMD
ncbi:MAG: hypothetical protein HGA25_07935 [Clostridiales bacterium]|nr:hypothetical protein [Clostridiales bacterium]